MDFSFVLQFLMIIYLSEQNISNCSHWQPFMKGYGFFVGFFMLLLLGFFVEMSE